MGIPAGAMDTFLLDLRLGWRSLRRNATFSAAALLTLALGIGGTCAIFGVLNAVFLRPLPFAGEASLIRLRDFTAAPGGAMSPVNITGRHFLEILAQSRTLSGISAQTGRSATLAGGHSPERVDTVLLSPGSLAVLGVALISTAGPANPLLDGHRRGALRRGGAPLDLASRRLLGTAGGVAHRWRSAGGVAPGAHPRR
jgi:hypothetical protein